MYYRGIKKTFSSRGFLLCVSDETVISVRKKINVACARELLSVDTFNCTCYVNVNICYTKCGYFYFQDVN